MFIKNKERFDKNNKNKNIKGKNKNSKNSNKNAWMFQYADIKLNILMEHNGMSMIVEIQYLLKCMLESKKRAHHLYEILRSEGFRNDMEI